MRIKTIDSRKPGTWDRIAAAAATGEPFQVQLYPEQRIQRKPTKAKRGKRRGEVAETLYPLQLPGPPYPGRIGPSGAT